MFQGMRFYTKDKICGHLNVSTSVISTFPNRHMSNKVVRDKIINRNHVKFNRRGLNKQNFLKIVIVPQVTVL